MRLSGKIHIKQANTECGLTSTDAGLYLGGKEDSQENVVNAGPKTCIIIFTDFQTKFLFIRSVSNQKGASWFF